MKGWGFKLTRLMQSLISVTLSFWTSIWEHNCSVIADLAQIHWLPMPGHLPGKLWCTLWCWCVCWTCHDATQVSRLLAEMSLNAEHFDHAMLSSASAHRYVYNMQTHYIHIHETQMKTYACTCRVCWLTWPGLCQSMCHKTCVTLSVLGWVMGLLVNLASTVSEHVS